MDVAAGAIERDRGRHEEARSDQEEECSTHLAVFRHSVVEKSSRPLNRSDCSRKIGNFSDVPEGKKERGGPGLGMKGGDLGTHFLSTEAKVRHFRGPRTKAVRLRCFAARLALWAAR